MFMNNILKFKNTNNENNILNSKIKSDNHTWEHNIFNENSIDNSFLKFIYINDKNLNILN
jgi:hypothetical protein